MYKKDHGSSQNQKGWATLELVMVMPLIIGLIAVIFYFGQLSFLRLHLTSVVDAAARVASIESCDRGRSFVRESFSNLSSPLTVECSEGEHIRLTASTQFRSSLPFFEQIEKPVVVTAIVLNEKAWEEEE